MPTSISNGESGLSVRTKLNTIWTNLVTSQITVDGDAVFTTGDTIRLNTSDGSDNGVLAVAGGGGNSDARGAKVRFYGNEHSSLGGVLDLAAGNVSGGHIYNYTNAKLRQKIDYNGDISFYEDTGTTAKFFWDASTERLGIGNAAPNTTLDITTTSNTNGFVLDVIGTAPNYMFDVRDDGTSKFRIDSSNNVGIGEIPQTDLNTAYDHLQIGKPANIMGSDSQGGLWLNSGAFFNSAGNWEYLLSSETVSSLTMTNSVPFRFRYAAAGTAGNTFSWSEAARIDANGNLLVGTTDASPSNNSAGSTADNGLALKDNGELQVAAYNGTANSGSVGYFNRTSTDGDIVQFRKDGATVGSIGSYAGAELVIGTDETGLLFGDGGDNILPYDVGATPTRRDNAISFGNENYRFKDLYLSGVGHINGEVNVLTAGTMIQHDYLNSGTYVQEVRGDDRLLTLASKTNDSNAGIVFEIHSNEKARFNNAGNLAFTNGNGIDFSASEGSGASSSVLDDYEEGTWTPVFADATSGGNTVTSSSGIRGVYTKIGNMVTVNCSSANLDTTGMTTGNDLRIQGLPFTPTSYTSPNQIYVGATQIGSVAFSTSGFVQAYGLDNATYVRLGESTNGGTLDVITVGQLTSGSADIQFTITYFTSA